MLSLFQNNQPVLAGVDVDLKLSESHSSTATVTNTAIEDGTQVGNHIILQPDTLEVTAEVSNYDGAFNFGMGERAKTALQEFKTLLKSRALFDVVTFHEIYTSMALVSVKAINEAPMQGRLAFSLSFQKVDLGNLSFIRIPQSQLASGVKKTGSSEVDAGRQSALTSEDAPKRTSILAAFFG